MIIGSAVTAVITKIATSISAIEEEYEGTKEFRAVNIRDIFFSFDIIPETKGRNIIQGTGKDLIAAVVLPEFGSQISCCGPKLGIGVSLFHSLLVNPGGK